MKLWGGRFEKDTAKEVEEFSRSLETDKKMWESDILASMAHARMLGHQNIIPSEDSQAILSGLESLRLEFSEGKINLNQEAEDLHSEIEAQLFQKIGEPAKRLHTGRSRNDQVVTDTRLHLLKEIETLLSDIFVFQKEILRQSEENIETVMPGMTHFQHAQPVSLGHHLMAYFWMFDRDRQRIEDSVKRISSLPLGSAALAGTGFPIDRRLVQNELGFQKISENSLDAVSDRDFVIEFLSHASLIMMHLSRLSEEFIIWSSPEFGYLELGDEVTTGSSIMPQKKNPDVAELIRGRVGRVYGALMGSLTMMKGLPLAYNRDMQEDKIHLFEGLETVGSCLRLACMMLKNAHWKTDRMKKSLKGDFSNATELADELVRKGLSFREAHEIVGELVQYCLKQSCGLEDLTLDQLRKFHPTFDQQSLRNVLHESALQARNSEGGTSPDSLLRQINLAKKSMGPRL